MTDKEYDKEYKDILKNIKIGKKVINSFFEKSTPIAAEFVSILTNLDKTTIPANSLDKTIPTKVNTMSSEPDCLIDNIENETKIIIKLPGVSKENIKINVKNNIIKVEANVLKKMNWEHLTDVYYIKTIDLDETIEEKNLITEFSDCILYFIYKHNNQTEFDIRI